MTGQRDIIVDVVEGLAAADRVAPDELDYTLYDYIDPEILTNLADLEDGTWEFAFRVSDHHVTITSDGQLRIDGVVYQDDLPVER